MLADNLQELILAAPDHAEDGLAVARTATTESGMDPVAGARAIFQSDSILTFSQLSWPTDDQLAGNDGGLYRASAQLFVDELLALHGGSAKMRAFLAALPQYYNWQTAFWQAYGENFSTPLETEKWWALQSVLFESRSPGPQWTAAASREKLDEILSVTVDYRYGSTNLPVRAEISLQNVISTFDYAQQTEILEGKLRDLELAQFRMAPALAVLTAEYRNTLAGYLGELHPTRREMALNKRAAGRVPAGETLSRLDALDARRRAIALAANE
jgi:hypothetical protein